MRLSTPRIPPLADDQLDRAQLADLGLNLKSRDDKIGRGLLLNIFRTLLHAPDALRPFLAYGNYIMSSQKNSLSPRLRELVILRTGWLCKSGYEFSQHSRIGRDCGLSDQDIESVKGDPNADIWSPLESAMLKATDELVFSHHLSDQTWNALSEIGDKGRIDLVMTVGQYTQVSMMLNSFGVQLEDGHKVDPELVA